MIYLQKKYASRLVFIFISFFIFSCKKKETTTLEYSNNSNTFFSLDSFANDEIIRHLKEKTQIEKTINLNGNQEKHRIGLEKIGWKKELQPLFKNDINKVAWKDKFIEQRMDNSNGDYSIIYSTMAKEINVKKLQIDFNTQNQIELITINIDSKNLLFNAKQLYTYSPKLGYHLKSDQKALFLSQNTLVVNGNFINTKP